MKETIFYFLMHQNCISSTQKIQKSKDFTNDNMKKIGLKGVVKVFSADYNAIDTNDILDIHIYLMKET